MSVWHSFGSLSDKRHGNLAQFDVDSIEISNCRKLIFIHLLKDFPTVIKHGVLSTTDEMTMDF